jgi:endonuclease/exonuclease/phosphatase family metal-dependent hydrolase
MFRLSTWNCFGMGQGLSAVTAVRAPWGARLRDASVLSECSEADILCVQELLSREAQQFFDGVGAHRLVSRFRDDNRVRFGGGVTMRGCGLGIGARSALRATRIRTFPGAGVGWDRLARKGALYAQLAVARGVTIDVINVHLQAGRGVGAVAVRARQLSDLQAFVRSVSAPDRPCIICGDFNIDGLSRHRDGAPYQALLGAMAGFTDLGAEGDLPTIEPLPHGNELAHALDPSGASQRLDYVFWRPARGAVDWRCTGLSRFFDRPLATGRNGKAAWASDHYGLCARFEAA